MIPADGLDLDPPELDARTVNERVMARIAPLFEDALNRRDGTARQCTWEAEDGWLIMYTTSRVNGGPFHDRFAVFAYKPTGKGARSGKGAAERHEAVYNRGFATRKTAKARAVKLYRQHSPKWHAAHPEKETK